jgi:hypothetical protein
MIALLCFFLTLFATPFKSKSRLVAENAVLRHQLTILQRKVRGRVRLTNSDRLFLVQLYRWFPSILTAITIIRPTTLVRWHRAGFRRYWRWKSRSFGGRPQIDTDLRALIRRMSIENPLWGAPHTFMVNCSSLASRSLSRQSLGICAATRGRHRKAGARFCATMSTASRRSTFLSFRRSRSGSSIVLSSYSMGRRIWVSFGVTANPTAEWISRQITEAFPWDHAPRYLIRDRDTSYGPAFVQRLRAMGIRDRPIAFRSPWQNAFRMPELGPYGSVRGARGNSRPYRDHRK